MRHHKEVWKQNFKLIFILIQLSEIHGQEGLNKMRFSNNGAEFEPLKGLSKEVITQLNPLSANSTHTQTILWQ